MPTHAANCKPKLCGRLTSSRRASPLEYKLLLSIASSEEGTGAVQAQELPKFHQYFIGNKRTHSIPAVWTIQMNGNITAHSNFVLALRIPKSMNDLSKIPISRTTG
jgi:hypothetical protein